VVFGVSMLYIEDCGTFQKWITPMEH